MKGLRKNDEKKKCQLPTRFSSFTRHATHLQNWTSLLFPILSIFYFKYIAYKVVLNHLYKNLAENKEVYEFSKSQYVQIHYKTSLDLDEIVHFLPEQRPQVAGHCCVINVK